MSDLPSLLWIDFAAGARPHSDLCRSIAGTYLIHRLSRPSDICAVVESTSPWAACFEYESPTPATLRVLEKTRQRFRSLPIVMLVARRYKDLAAWALNLEIGAYLKIPCPARDLRGSLRSLERSRNPRQLSSAPPADNSSEQARILPAISYLRANYVHKIPLAKAAGMCDLDRFQFSRIFKKVNGITFQTYIVELRIQRAAELMKTRGATVTEAAFNAGFNDLSYFARMFRKQVGVTPSRYRTGTAPGQILLFPDVPRMATQDTASRAATKS